MFLTTLRKYLAYKITLVAIFLLSASVGYSKQVLIPPQVAIPKTYFGLHIHRATPAKWPDVEFGSWRLHDAYVGWFSLQPAPMKWRFNLLDRYLKMARPAGVELLLPLAFPPRWASAKPDLKGPYQLGSSAPPKELIYWRDYVEKVAVRYKGQIREYELWNEASEPGFFSGTQEDLLALAQEAYAVLKRVDPNNRLVSPSAVGTGGHLRWLAAYLEKGGSKFADIINYHFYVPKYPPEMMLSRIHDVKVILQRLGLQDMPLWNTETGWRIANGDGTPENAAAVDHRWLKLNAEQAAAYVSRALILGWAAGLERFYWYAWDNQNMGLVEPSNNKLKPAGMAYKTVSKWLIGTKMKRCSEESSGLWECILERGVGEQARVIWSAKGKTGYCLPPTWAGGQAYYLDGKNSPVSTACIKVDQMPIMLVPAPNDDDISSAEK